jgi:hypothetical protein
MDAEQSTGRGPDRVASTPLAMINTKREKCDTCGSRAHWWAYKLDRNFCQDCAREAFNWKPLKVVVDREEAP